MRLLDMNGNDHMIDEVNDSTQEVKSKTNLLNEYHIPI